MQNRVATAVASKKEARGVPEGLPYLTGFVCMHEASLEGAA